MMSNIQRKKFALNVRRDGPQPSIFVRSFGAITSEACPRPGWLVLFRGGPLSPPVGWPEHDNNNE